MPYYDQHVHTYFSFDSQAQFEDYLRQTELPFVSTDHLEMANPDDDGRDDLPDFDTYVTKIGSLRQRFENQIRLGVECGYFAPKLSETYDYLNANTYDLILLSFHHDGHYDYQDAHFQHVDKKQHVIDYYNRMLEGVENFEGADVLAHFDYGLRVLDVTPEELTAWAAPQLKAIFKVCVEKQLAFEVNTKSMFTWHDEALYELVLPWFQEAGGQLITLGSDAHTSDKFEMDFDLAKEFLHRHHVNKLAVYENHQPTLVTY